MSQLRCEVTGEKRADNVTCGGLCKEFPGCLSEPLPELLDAISRFARQELAERQNQESAVRTLTQLHWAITQGLNGSEDDGQLRRP
jgi:hypothetical protein